MSSCPSTGRDVNVSEMLQACTFVPRLLSSSVFTLGITNTQAHGATIIACIPADAFTGSNPCIISYMGMGSRSRERKKNSRHPSIAPGMSFTESMREDAKETWRAVVEHPFTGMMISYRGMRASPHLFFQRYLFQTLSRAAILRCNLSTLHLRSRCSRTCLKEMS